MEAREGVLFLRQLLQSPQFKMDAADLEEAIRLAGQHSPSAAIDKAARHYCLAHPSAGQMECLHFAKGVRWLAMLRRDEGRDAFEAAADQLRGGGGAAATKILWLSQHQPLASQIAELKRLFGNDLVLEQDPRPFSSAEDITKRYRQGGYGNLVVVAPLSVIARLVDLGIKPLWAEMHQVELPQAEVRVKGRGYRFNRFRRIKALNLVFEEIE